MKTKFKKNGRRLLAAILCLVMAVMALPMSAFAWTSEEGVSCTSSFGDYYVGSDGGLSEEDDCSDCPYFCPVCGECMYEDDCEE